MRCPKCGQWMELSFDWGQVNTCESCGYIEDDATPVGVPQGTVVRQTADPAQDPATPVPPSP